jgi:phage tail-like protein
MPESGARYDPFLSFCFEVRLDGLSVAGFSECSGIQVETETQDYQEGGLNSYVLKFPTRTRQSNVVLKRGIANRELWDWYDRLVQGRIVRRNGSIVVFEPDGGKPVIEWQFRQAFPCKWIGPDLNASQSSVAIETLELCHQGLERRR